ncbi:MAG: MarP family serine protease [Actinomycetota bacterium]|nr:MarP family serine protease [Actinomycetota bacterium]
MIDLLIVAFTVLFAINGYRQGLITSAFSFLGFLSGAIIGAQLGGPLASAITDDSVARVIIALVLVFGLAGFGQYSVGLIGTRVREVVTWRPARVVDSVLGTLVSALTVLVVAWIVATPLAASPFPSLASQVRQSHILQAVDGAVPDPVRTLYQSLRESLDRQGLPDVLDPLTQTVVPDVAAPNDALLNSPVVAQVRDSVVKISGEAASCSRGINGSGFVYDDERVMTNAHVVAGVDDPSVVADGSEYDATIVYVDEQIDIAVLAVPGLPQAPLPFGGIERDTGADALIMGYPGGGELRVGSARIRDLTEIQGPTFRPGGTVTREVYSLFGEVRAGNSGGPLLDVDGSVLGVVFASAIDDPLTGYALSADQVATAAVQGASSTSEVDSGPCA